MTLGEVLLHLRRAWRGLVFAPIAALLLVVALQPFVGDHFTARATLLPPAGGMPGGGLASLAGQFGVRLGGMSSEPAPAFYAALARDPFVARRGLDRLIASDDAASSTLAGLADALDVPAASGDTLIEQVAGRLAEAMQVRLDAEGGFLALRLTLPDRELAVRALDAVLGAVSALDLEWRQRRAADDRGYAEARLAQEQAALRAAEDRLNDFERRNRNWQAAPTLALAHSRLQDDVTQQDGVVRSMRTAFDQARLDALRDTPALSVVQPATASIVPDERRVAFRAVLAAAVALLLAGTAIIARAWWRSVRAALGSPRLHAEDAEPTAVAS